MYEIRRKPDISMNAGKDHWSKRGGQKKYICKCGHHVKWVSKYEMLNHVALCWEFSLLTHSLYIDTLDGSMTSGLDWAGLTSDSSFTMAEVEATQAAQVDVSKTNSVPGEGYDKKCIFCKIVNNEMSTELLHSVRIFLTIT